MSVVLFNIVMKSHCSDLCVRVNFIGTFYTAILSSHFTISPKKENKINAESYDRSHRVTFLVNKCGIIVLSEIIVRRKIQQCPRR